MCVSEPEDPPAGVETTVMNSTVRVKWSEVQNVRGLLLGYKVPELQTCLGLLSPADWCLVKFTNTLV